jgi:ABC-type uncharacterized transport system substrate-binding protein
MDFQLRSAAEPNAEGKERPMLQIMKIIAAVVVIGLGIQAPTGGANASSTAPITNHGKKWRIAYYEGGSYINYPINLRTIVAGLVELGWLAPVDIPDIEDKTLSKPVWDYLAKHTRSACLEFVPDGYWCAKWDSGRRAKIKETIIQRLNQKKDIDFMIAMGTWAGQDLANDRHHVPTMVVSVSDPVRSGISASADDSGLDHVHAKCDPTRYIRQLRLFHRLFDFKTMGVVYENTVEGRTYAAMDDIQQVAAERHFSVVRCEAPFSGVDLKTSTDRIIECHEQLARSTDAVFVTVHRGLDANRMPEIVAPFLAHKIPTWSQRGPQEVKKGILFSVSRGGFRAVGRFHAEVMARVFNGEKPRDIEQIFEDPKLIAVNTKVAQIIGYQIPDSILKIADIVYDKIER